MSSPFSSNQPLGYCGIDPYVTPQIIQAQRAPTTQDIWPGGTQWQFNNGATKVIYETTGAGIWNIGSNAAATTTAAGIVTLTDNNEPVATKFYVDAAIAGVVVGAVPAATIANMGIVELATDAEAIAGTPSGATAFCVQPSNLAAVFASPSAIGGTLAAAGSFTTLAASSNATVVFPSSLRRPAMTLPPDPPPITT